MQIEVREMTPDDWPAVREIYRRGIESGDATFEREPPDWETWHARRHPKCRLVAECEETVVGFACVSATSERAVYSGVCEIMVYVAEENRGHGIGGRLMASLVSATEAQGIWTLESSIFPENVASIRVHERVGFRVVGTRERVGRFHDGRWRDTVLMERRSSITGLE
jgi:phosphinothricin acetyltransferase